MIIVRPGLFVPPVAPRQRTFRSRLVRLSAKETLSKWRGIHAHLLYNPDNGVTRNFMPHLWMFLLQSLTPEGHEVVLIDGNAQPMDEAGIARFVREQNIGLVGIGAMTRMIAKAYRMADAIRAVGVPVVMGGPHVTEEADEALGRNGGPRHADAVALGEAEMKPGQGSSRTPRAASSRMSTLRWMRLDRKANPVSRNIRRFPGTK